jgi:hypothetical protein
MVHGQNHGIQILGASKKVVFAYWTRCCLKCLIASFKEEKRDYLGQRLNRVPLGHDKYSRRQHFFAVVWNLISIKYNHEGHFSILV